MKNKVLKLCKRLNKITIEEILPILMATEDKVIPTIKELQAEGKDPYEFFLSGNQPVITIQNPENTSTSFGNNSKYQKSSPKFKTL